MILYNLCVSSYAQFTFLLLDFWTSGHDNNSPGQFQWSTGGDISRDNWADSVSEEDKLSIFLNHIYIRDGQWHLGALLDFHKFVCERTDPTVV